MAYCTNVGLVEHTAIVRDSDGRDLCCFSGFLHFSFIQVQKSSSSVLAPLAKLWIGQLGEAGGGGGGGGGLMPTLLVP